MVLILKAPNTTIAEFANTVDPDETAHNESSHRKVVGSGPGRAIPKALKMVLVAPLQTLATKG